MLSNRFTAPELASVLAGQAVDAAASYLDGRSSGEKLSREADRMFLEMQLVGDDSRCNVIADPTRLLLRVMKCTASAPDSSTKDWAAIMEGFVVLLRKASSKLAATGSQQQ